MPSSPLKLIDNYLCNRKQRRKINSLYCEQLEIVFEFHKAPSLSPYHLTNF